MIGPAQAGSVAAIRTAAQRALDNGAQWIKLMATAGVATPGDAVLASNFSREEIRAAVEVADRGGARVMVHTWGGNSADWAVEAGAASLEHGIYLTQEQVSRAADAGITLVPTLTIYRHVRDMVLDGRLGGIPWPRIVDVIEAHELVVRRARDSGLPLAIGSDFTVPWQHGTNLVEVGTLQRAGLTSGEALLAATSNGARLLRDGGSGVIAAGHRADAVLLSGDPSDPATFENPSSVAAVVKDGILVHAEGLSE
jgi:imidazolonepropionase-like amidohydrolase